MTDDNQYYRIETIESAANKFIFLLLDKNTKKLIIEKNIKKPCNTDIYKQLMAYPHPGLSNIIKVTNSENEIKIIENYVEGETLDKVINEGILNKNLIMKVMIQLCDAVNHLHHLDPPIIHRDLKPENIIYYEGKVTIIDFDISRNYLEDKQKDTHVLGSLGFAAPEQFGFKQCDQRADIYALGVILNVMCTGNHPNENLVEGSFKKIVEKCIEIDPNNRYQNCTEFKKEFESEFRLQPINTTTLFKLNIPGFRSGKILNMVIAVFGYLMILVLTTNMTMESPGPPIELFLMKCSIFVGLLLWVAIFTNYGNLYTKFNFIHPRSLLGNVVFKFLISFALLFISVSFFAVIFLIIG